MGCFGVVNNKHIDKLLIFISRCLFQLGKDITYQYIRNYSSSWKINIRKSAVWHIICTLIDFVLHNGYVGRTLENFPEEEVSALFFIEGHI
jgi:hypothetical protein